MKLLSVSFAAMLLLVAASDARAWHGPLDTLTMAPGGMSLPAVALDAGTGARHVAYIVSGTLYHGTGSGVSWQSEAITDSASTTSFSGLPLEVAADGHPVTAYVRNGTLVCAVREAGGWVRDTLDGTLTKPFVALALDPVSSDPAVAWARLSATPGTPSQVFYAHKSAGVWTTQQVDTVTGSHVPVALALDATGLPHLAWARPRADNVPARVLTYAAGADPLGSFTSAPVDSMLWAFMALEVDRSNAEPRLAYDVMEPYYQIRYAYRGPGNAWEWVLVQGASYFGGNTGPSLVLDPTGRPIVVYSDVTPIEPGQSEPTEPSEILACSGITTGFIQAYYRASGEGPDPFTMENLSNPERDSRNGAAAIASVAQGEAVVVWRGNCTPYSLTSTQLTLPPILDVDGGPAPGAPLSPVRPNPARVGDDLRVEFTLACEAEATLELHDLVGRRVAARTLARMPAGRQGVTWAAPNLSPGLYWLTVRSDGERIGSRAVIILR